MIPPTVDYLGEGRSDEVVAAKVILAAGALPGTSYGRPSRGKANLDRRVQGLNAGVAFGRPILILRDFDHDAACPAALVAKMLPARHPNCFLRICVREVEAWLMADRAEYARACGLPIGAVPSRPEEIDDLKAVVLGWVAASRAPKLKRHLDDARRRAVADWAALGEWHAVFATSAWDPVRAATSGAAPSLARTLNRLRATLDLTPPASS